MAEPDACFGEWPITGMIDWKDRTADALAVLQDAYPDVAVLRSDAIVQCAADQQNDSLENGLDTLGQALSAHGYALYALDTGSDDCRFILPSVSAEPAEVLYTTADAPTREALYLDAVEAELTGRLCRRKKLAWGRKIPATQRPAQLWDDMITCADRSVLPLRPLCGALAFYRNRDNGSYDVIVDLAAWAAMPAHTRPAYADLQTGVLRGLGQHAHLDTLQRRTDGVCATLFYKELYNRPNVRGVCIGTLHMPLPEWVPVQSLDQYVDPEYPRIAFRWLGDQLIVLSHQPRLGKVQPARNFILRYDATGQMQDATPLPRGAQRIELIDRSVEMCGTRDGNLYFCAECSLWAVMRDGVRRLGVYTAALPVTRENRCRSSGFCPAGDSGLCFVSHDNRVVPDNPGAQALTLYHLDMQTGALRSLCLDGLKLPVGCLVHPRAAEDGWVLLDMAADGYKVRHLAVLWHVPTGAFYAIPVGSFGTANPDFFYVPDVGRVFARHMEERTTYRGLPWTAFLHSIREKPKNRLNMPDWDMRKTETMPDGT